MHIGVSFKMYLDRSQTRQWCTAVAAIAERHPAIRTHGVEQLDAALARLTESTPLVVAYEPVWAIGQTEAASASHVAEVARCIKSGLADRAGFADTPVVYGGSAAPGTLTELGRSVDGLFLGRFAHDIGAFEQILDEAAART